MNSVTFGLYAEGRTDERFLPILIRRASENVLIQYDRSNIEAIEPILIKVQYDSYPDRADRIRAAAQEACGYHALIIHADADDLDYQQAYNERFKPGLERVRVEQNVCRELIPIIPVRMIEAWMLADIEALEKVLDTAINPRSLQLKKTHQVEKYQDPKSTLESIIQSVFPNKQKQWSRIKGLLYAELAPLIRLSCLKQVPAYKEFEQELSRVLKILNLIQ